MSQDFCNCTNSFKYYDECVICGEPWEKKGMINMTFSTLCSRTDKRLKQIIKSEKYSDSAKQTAQRIIDARDRVKVNTEVVEALVDSILVMSKQLVGTQSDYYAEEAIKKCRSVLESLGEEHES